MCPNCYFQIGKHKGLLTKFEVFLHLNLISDSQWYSLNIWQVKKDRVILGFLFGNWLFSIAVLYKNDLRIYAGEKIRKLRKLHIFLRQKNDDILFIFYPRKGTIVNVNDPLWIVNLLEITVYLCLSQVKCYIVPWVLFPSNFQF